MRRTHFIEITKTVHSREIVTDSDHTRHVQVQHMEEKGGDIERRAQDAPRDTQGKATPFQLTLHPFTIRPRSVKTTYC